MFSNGEKEKASGRMFNDPIVDPTNGLSYAKIHVPI